MSIANLFEFLRRQFCLHKATIASILFISVIGLISISWFQGDFLITGLDCAFPPDRTMFFIRGFSYWDMSSLGGVNSRVFAFLVPTNVFLVISEVIGLSLVNAEKLWFYGLFTSAGLSMYFLAITGFRGKYRHLFGITSALFYMFNPYAAIMVVPQMWLFIIFLPLILGMYIKGLEEGRGLKYILLISLIWMLTATSAYTNPKFVVFHLAPIFLYLVLHILLNRSANEIKRSLRFTGLLLVVWSALNAFWILPVAFSLKNVIESPLVAYATIGLSRLESYSLGSAPILEAFRLLGFWSLSAEHKGFPYFYWAPTYSNPLFIAIGFLIPILAFTPLLHKPKDKKVLFFGIVTVIGLFIMNGSNPPLGWINEYIVTHIPLVIDVFSNPYMFGGMYVALGYAFLLGYAISAFCSSIRSAKKVFTFRKPQLYKYLMTGLTLFLIIGLYAFPLWNGEVIYPGNEVLASNRYNIPSYYYEARDWLSTDQEDFRIFPLPYSIVGYGVYNWTPAGFNGPDPTELLLGKPLVLSLSGGGIGLEVARYMVSGSTDKVAKILSLMNVKYLLFHRDSNWAFLSDNGWYVSASPEQIQTILNNQKGLSFEKTFGEIDFYRNNYWQPMQIYASRNVILTDGGTSQLMSIAKRNDFKPSENIIVLSSQLGASQFSSFPIDTVFFQGTDPLNLILSNVGGSITTNLNPQSIFINNEQIIAHAAFIADNTQNHDIWIKLPYTYSPAKVSIKLGTATIVNDLELPANSLMASSWIHAGKTVISKGNHTLTLTITDGQTIPTKVMFTPDQASEMLSNVLQESRIICALEPQPLINARYYAGWKGVISTNGQGDPDMLIFQSPTSCPYIRSFPMNFTSWNAHNSTLIYITTASSPLTINSISADGDQTSAYAWWETGTSWETGWPITIPPHQHAIIQVNQHANVISPQTDNDKISLKVTDGWKNPPPTKAPSKTSTTMFAPKAGNYLLAVKVATGYGYESLLTKIDNQTFSIDTSSREKGPVFIYKYIGPIILTAGYHTISISLARATTPVTYPIIIPPNQKAIMQINHKADNVTFAANSPLIDNMFLCSLENGESFADVDNLLSSNQTNSVSVTYERINPTQYTVHVDASKPFYLVFSESYDKEWIASINGQQIPDQNHFTANGYANGWYINKTGTYTVTLEFWPQKLFYASAAISITTLIVCAIYISTDKIKIIYQKHIKNSYAR